MAAELLDDLRRLVADSDKAGEGWASAVCGRAIAEITRLQEELLFVAAESEKQDDEIERLRSELSQRNVDAKPTTLRPDTRADRNRVCRDS